MDQKEILEQAKALGKQLSSHPRIKAFLEAQQRLEGDPTAVKLLSDYQGLTEKMQRAQAEGRKVTEQDANQLRSLQQDLATNDAVKAWMRTQSDYVDLMYRIDRGIQEGLAEAMGRPGGQQAGGTHQNEPFIPRIVPGSGQAEA